MSVILVIVVIAGLIAGGVYLGIKKGKIKDADGDFIPDAVEEKVEKAEAAIKKTAGAVKQKAQRVAEELKDVASAAKEVVNQAGDVADAAKGKSRSGRKPRRNNKNNFAKKEAPASNSSASNSEDISKYYNKNRKAE